MVVVVLVVIIIVIGIRNKSETGRDCREFISLHCILFLHCLGSLAGIISCYFIDKLIHDMIVLSSRYSIHAIQY